MECKIQVKYKTLYHVLDSYLQVICNVHIFVKRFVLPLLYCSVQWHIKVFFIGFIFCLENCPLVQINHWKTKCSIYFQLWGIALRLLLGPGPHATYKLQSILPKQPLPDLDDTLSRYSNYSSYDELSVCYLLFFPGLFQLLAFSN